MAEIPGFVALCACASGFCSVSCSRFSSLHALLELLQLLAQLGHFRVLRLRGNRRRRERQSAPRDALHAAPSE